MAGMQKGEMLSEHLKTVVQDWKPIGSVGHERNADDTAFTSAIGRYNRGVYTKDMPDPETDGQRTFFTGNLQAHRRRSLGLVSELMESQKAKRRKDRLDIDDQEVKIVELQHALIEEAKFLERLRAYNPDEKMCCQGLCGSQNSCFGPCCKCHCCMSVDEDCYTVEIHDKKYYCSIQ